MGHITATTSSSAPIITTSSTNANAFSSLFYLLGQKIHHWFIGEDSSSIETPASSTYPMGIGLESALKKFGQTVEAKPFLTRTTKTINSPVGRNTPIIAVVSPSPSATLGLSLLQAAFNTNLTHVIAVPGDATLEQALLNTERTKDLLGPKAKDLKILQGPDTFLSNPNATDVSLRIRQRAQWGADGFGDLKTWKNETLKIESEDYIQVVLAKLKTDSLVTLLVDGPLTLPAILLAEIKKAEELDGVKKGTYFNRIQEMFIKAGCFEQQYCYTPINDTEKGEYNALADLEATKAFFAYFTNPEFGFINFPVFLIPNNIKKDLYWNANLFEQLRSYGTPLAKKLAALTTISPKEGPHVHPALFLALAVHELFFFHFNCGHVTVGTLGQLSFNPSIYGNVCVLTINPDMKDKIYEHILGIIGNYGKTEQASLIVGGILFGLLGIGTIVATVLSIYKCIKEKRENQDKLLDDEDLELQAIIDSINEEEIPTFVTAETLLNSSEVATDGSPPPRKKQIFIDKL